MQPIFPMTLRGWADLYAWQLDRASRTPLTRQIYMQVRSAVLSGALRPGTRMPSSRAMASKLGVARASVVLAYEHLLAEGYVESRHGSGTFIAGDLTGLASRRRGAPRATRRAEPTAAQTFSDFERSAAQSDARPFNTGRTLVDARTTETWRSLTHRAVRRLGPNDLGYADPAGLAELRANICDYLRVARAVRCEPDQIVVTAGTQQAIDIAIRVLLSPGDEVHALIGQRHLEPAGGAARQCLRQRIALLAIELADAADVRGEMALLHELGNDNLLQRRGLPVDQIARADEGGQQGPWHHGIADAQARK